MKPAVYDGYIRVSRVGGRAGDSFISPAVQREQIAAWATMRGVTIDAWHEDLDQSGGKLDRPGLAALLDRIETGDTGGVVVAKLDRLSRLGVADALKLVERITDAGGVIAALDLGLDPTTPFGEFGMTIMLAMARMERRRLADSWEVAKGRAMDRGAKIGPTPLGYTREADGTLTAHPDHAHIISEAYSRAAAGDLQDALAYLRGAVPERDWSTFTVRRLLATRTYLGESHYGERVERDAQPALTDLATWTAAQSEQAATRRPKATFPLSGIAVCGTCGARMVGSRVGDGKRGYRCSASLARYKGQRCPAPANPSAEPVEELVRAALQAALGSEGWSIGAQSDVDLASAEQALAAAEAELDAFAADLTARQALGDSYGRHLSTRADAVEQARTDYAAQANRTAKGTRILAAELFDTEDPAELRELFAGALDGVVVARGRQPIADRVRIILKGEDRQARVAAA